MHKRKGWLFSDTVKGAIASANLYSLVETAKANGVEPHAYLSLLFDRLPLAATVQDFEALLPWNLSAKSGAREPHSIGKSMDVRHFHARCGYLSAYTASNRGRRSACCLRYRRRTL
jgi:hypothetical protein